MNITTDKPEDDIDEPGEMTPTEAPDTESDEDQIAVYYLRGYDITAIVVCCIIVAAIFMCYVTWKFRYAIVLRTKDQQSTTIVHDLIVMTAQNLLQNTPDNEYETLHGPGDVMRLPSWDVTSKSPAVNRQKASTLSNQGRRRARYIALAGPKRSPLRTSGRSRRISGGGVTATRPKASSIINKKPYKKLSLSSIKLSSGLSLTVPRKGDQRSTPHTNTDTTGISPDPLDPIGRHRTESGNS